MHNLIGQMIDGRYEILELIGTGGMAEVYRALCHRLNRYVAIKFLKEEYALDEDFRRRFYDEAQSVAMLSHPNIVGVYDVSKSVENQYIVMELIDGITLKSYLERRGRLSWKETTFFAMQISRALEHAHSKGIIHRDIKPQNIMLLRDGTVKVADFGIAHQMDRNITVSEAIGSVHYVAPEQARGSAIDNRADIYSLGVVMYEMLTGRLPFEGENAASIALQHMNSLPLAPSDYVSDIPVALEQITMKAMAFKVSSRYASATAMLNDLEAFKNDPKVSLDISIEENDPDPDDEEEYTRKIVNTGEARTHSDIGDKKSTSHFSASLIFALIAIGVFLVGATFAVVKLSNLFSGPTDVKLSIPNIIGYTFEEVIENEKYDVFEIRKGEEIYNDNVAAGVIIDQDPVSGKPAKNGDVIVVTVSKGPKTYTMKNLAGMEYKAAEAVLKRNGIASIEKFEYSDTVEKDFIISTDPGEGTVLSSGDEVMLTISLGAEPRMTFVPELLGHTAEEAQQLIKECGLKCSGVVEVESEEPDGTVIYQSIDADTEVEEGTAIEIHVSKNKASETSETDPTNPPEPVEGVTVDYRIEIGEYSGTMLLDVYLDDLLYYTTELSEGYRVTNLPITAEPGTHNIKVFQNRNLITDEDVLFE